MVKHFQLSYFYFYFFFIIFFYFQECGSAAKHPGAICSAHLQALCPIKLEIIIMHHKFFSTSAHILGSPFSIDPLKWCRKFTSQHEVTECCRQGGRWTFDLYPQTPMKAAVENPIIPNGIVTASQDRLPVETLAQPQPGWEARPHTWLLQPLKTCCQVKKERMSVWQ